jgi:endonuclease YncB( thermonuclease family)
MSPFRAVVDRVIDGDTMWIRCRVRTRNSAPPASTPEGAAATSALKAKWRKGDRIEVAPIIVDQYGRILATITTAAAD